MIKFTNTLIAAALWTMLIAPVALARDLTDADKTALQNRIDGFEQAFQTNDIETVINVVPPKIMTFMAEKSGLKTDELRTAMIDATTQAMAAVTVVSYTMSLDQAAYSETSAGRSYALVPTETVMKVGENTMQSNTQTLAFADEGTWHLVRIDDPQQVGILTEVYPEFKGVEFPAGTMKMIEDK